MSQVGWVERSADPPAPFSDARFRHDPEQLASEIQKLPPADFCKLAYWIAERDQDRWDRQLEGDAAAGRLDALADEALREHRAGRTRPL